jgi:hypothetical protein
MITEARRAPAGFHICDWITGYREVELQPCGNPVFSTHSACYRIGFGNNFGTKPPEQFETVRAMRFGHA